MLPSCKEVFLESNTDCAVNISLITVKASYVGLNLHTPRHFSSLAVLTTRRVGALFKR